MDGRELAHQARLLRSEIGILVMSGRYNKLGSVDLPEGAMFLSKPFSITQLVTHVQHLMVAKNHRWLNYLRRRTE